MSQEKVDRYKQEKLNRKKENKKKKIQQIIGGVIATLVLILILVYLGWSVYKKFKPAEETTTQYENALTADELASLLAAQTEPAEEGTFKEPSSEDQTEKETKKKKKKDKETEESAETSAESETVTE